MSSRGRVRRESGMGIWATPCGVGLSCYAPSSGVPGLSLRRYEAHLARIESREVAPATFQNAPLGPSKSRFTARNETSN